MILLISHFFSSKLGKFLILSRSSAGMCSEPEMESSAGSISGRAGKCGQIHSICFEKDWSTYFYNVQHSKWTCGSGRSQPIRAVVGRRIPKFPHQRSAIFSFVFERMPGNLLSSPFAAADQTSRTIVRRRALLKAKLELTLHIEASWGFVWRPSASTQLKRHREERRSF